MVKEMCELENYEYVQKGFRVLVGSMSGYLGQVLRRTYQEAWWTEVLRTLSDQWDLPADGTYGELVDSLDIAICIRLLDRMWNPVFRGQLNPNCRTWAKELMGVRNIVAHIGQQDLEQPMAERALDTMALLCKEIDPEGAEEIRDIYARCAPRRKGTALPLFLVWPSLRQIPTVELWQKAASFAWWGQIWSKRPPLPEK